jgi:CBS domain-containing protein
MSDPNARIDQLAWPSFVVIPAKASLAEARLIAQGSSQGVFPVINDGGQLVGLITRDDLAPAFRGLG